MVRFAANLRNVMCIDPGLGGTGMAFFPRVREGYSGGGERLQMPELVRLMTPDDEFLVNRVREGEDQKVAKWAEFSMFMSAQVAKWARELEVGLTVLEWPEVWLGSVKGQASAGGGSLVKLTACASMYLFALYPYSEVLLVTAQEWKGQLPKKVIEKRVNDSWGGKKLTNHVCDAVGIGFSLQGGLG